MSWTPFLKRAIALYPFVPTDPLDPYQVRLSPGDACEVVEECGGWFKGKVHGTSGLVMGIFPAAYVQITGELEKPAPPTRMGGRSGGQLESLAGSPKSKEQKEERSGQYADGRTSMNTIGSDSVYKTEIASGVVAHVGQQESTQAEVVSLETLAAQQPVSQQSNVNMDPLQKPLQEKHVVVGLGTAGPLASQKLSSPLSSLKTAAKQTNEAISPKSSAESDNRPNMSNTPALPPRNIAASILAGSKDKEVTPSLASSDAIRKNNDYPLQPAKRDANFIPPPPPAKANTGITAKRNSVVHSKSVLKPGDVLPLEESGTMSLESSVAEIEKILTDWNHALKAHLVNGLIREYYEQKERISILLDLRRQVMSRDISEALREDVRREIIQLVESSRRTEEGYMVPRTTQGELADITNSGIGTLVDLHRDMWSSMKEASSSQWAIKATSRQAAAEAAANAFKPIDSARTDSKSLASGLLGMGDAKEKEALISEVSKNEHFQLLIDVKACIFSVGESTELFFSLYNGKKKQYLTEDYCLQLTNSGMPADVSIWGKMKCIFKDLTREDLKNDLYLVCHILRYGRLLYDEKNKDPRKKGEMFYRRPFGCAVMSLGNAERDIGKELLPPSDAMSIYTCEESNFTHIHEQLVEKNMAGLELAPRAKGIAFGMTLMAGELSDVKKIPAFVDGAPIPKLNFSEMDPGQSRNDLYITLIKGAFQQDGKTSAKNVEVSVRVITSSGKTVEGCVFRGSGHGAVAQSDFKSMVTYHENNPFFQETIRLRVPDDIFEVCHAFFTIWHVSTNSDKNAPFCFAYLPLTTERGCVIPDQVHELVCFKPFDGIDANSHGKTFYLNLNDPKLSQRKDSFAISTILCSTHRTQNADLHSLFKWKNQLDSNRLKVILKNVIAVQGSELVKFLRETFDVLFAIFDAKKDSFEIVDAAFSALVYTLDQLTTKFANWCPIVDSYASDIFKSGSVHQILLNLLKDKLNYTSLHETQPQPEKLKTLMLTCKCFKYLIKFIVSSFLIDSKSPLPTCDLVKFKTNMNEMLVLLNKLMSSPVDAFVGCKAFILRSVSSVFEDLKLVFSASEIGKIPCDFLAAVPILKSRKLNNDKLKLARNILDGGLVIEQASRAIIVPAIIALIQAHLPQIATDDLEEPSLCLSILRALCDLISTIPNSEEKIWELRSLLPELIRATLRIQKNAMGEIVFHPVDQSIAAFCKVDLMPDSITLVYNIFHQMNPDHIDRWLEESAVEDLEGFKLLLIDLLAVLNNGLRLPVYPDMWVVLHFLQISATIKLLQHLLKPLSTYFLSESNMPLELWRPLFSLGVTLLMYEQLQLEKFSATKQQFIIGRYGDVRGVFLVPHMRNLWQTLNKVSSTYVKGKKQIYIPVLKCTSFLVPQLLELSRTQVSIQTRAMAMDFYFDLICSEYEATGSLKDIERHTIDYLYHIANTSITVGDAFVEYLLLSLKDKMALVPAMSDFGLDFVRDVKQLYELMCALLKFPDTAVYEDDRTTVALTLMDYIAKSGIHTRREMYCRYVKYLVDLHVGLKNYVEAGMTQLIHLRQYQWSSKQVDILANYPAEAEQARKERIYLETLKLFDDGEAWERAISLSEELRRHYEAAYEYDKIADLLKLQAQYYSKILHSDRYYCTYYRVVFYGKGFPENEKEYIYRGEKMEPVMDFTNRIKKKFPNAKIFMSSDAPPAEMLAVNEQVISITTLQIVDTTFAEKFINESEEDLPIAPESVQRSILNNDIMIFQYSKAVQKSAEKKPSNEFKDLWVLKVVLTAEESFPTVRRRCGVISRSDEMIAPVHNALISIENKNKELREKIEKVKRAPAGPVDVGPMSMALNGTIDAAVNGGTQKYIEAFLTPQFVQENPDKASIVQQLKLALRDQMRELKIGLQVFGTRSDEQLKGLHRHLSQFYDQMVEKMNLVLNK